MSEVQEQIEQVELSMEQAKGSIELMESFKRLNQSKDFKEIIEENYFKREASRLVLLKADDSMQSDEHQASIMKQIDAIGEVRKYFVSIMQMGRMAENALHADQRTHNELLNEED